MNQVRVPAGICGLLGRKGGLVAALLLMSSCAAPRTPSLIGSPDASAVRHNIVRGELLADLRAVAPASSAASTTVRARGPAQAEVKLLLREERLEYRFALANPGGSRFGSAHLYSGADTESGDLVATLFSDAGLSSFHEDLRGTASYAASVDRMEMAVRLTSHPDDFFVVLVPSGSGVPLLGRLRKD